MIVLQWSQLDRILKIIVICGFVAGGYTASIGLLIIQFVSLNSPIMFGFAFLILLATLLPFVGSLSLLLIPISVERRGILGFALFVGSIIPIFLLATFLLKLVFPSRDSM